MLSNPQLRHIVFYHLGNILKQGVLVSRIDLIGIF
jgi:hypothetical protein